MFQYDPNPPAGVLTTAQMDPQTGEYITAPTDDTSAQQQSQQWTQQQWADYYHQNPEEYQKYIEYYQQQAQYSQPYEGADQQDDYSQQQQYQEGYSQGYSQGGYEGYGYQDGSSQHLAVPGVAEAPKPQEKVPKRHAHPLVCFGFGGFIQFLFLRSAHLALIESLHLPIGKMVFAFPQQRVLYGGGTLHGPILVRQVKDVIADTHLTKWASFFFFFF